MFQNPVITEQLRNAVKELIQKIKNNEGSFQLSIDIENLTINECQSIMNEMRHSTRISWLEFVGHESDNSAILTNMKVTHELGELIKFTTTLTSISFSGKAYANNDWAVAVANALKTNQSITSVHMTQGQVGDIGAQAFGEMLAVNKHLEHMGLIYNHITEIGLVLLAEGLKYNTSLTYLNVGSNQFNFDSEENKLLIGRSRPGLIITYNCS